MQPESPKITSVCCSHPGLRHVPRRITRLTLHETPDLLETARRNPVATNRQQKPTRNDFQNQKVLLETAPKLVQFMTFNLLDSRIDSASKFRLNHLQNDGSRSWVVTSRRVDRYVTALSTECTQSMYSDVGVCSGETQIMETSGNRTLIP